MVEVEAVDAHGSLIIKGSVPGSTALTVAADSDEGAEETEAPAALRVESSYFGSAPMGIWRVEQLEVCVADMDRDLGAEAAACEASICTTLASKSRC